MPIPCGSSKTRMYSWIRSILSLHSEPNGYEFEGKSSNVNAAREWRHYARRIRRENLICEFE